MRSRIAKVAVVFATAAATTAIFAGSALADPTGTTAVAAVGSDTTQFVVNDLAAAYNATTPTPPSVGSWFATGTSPIVTKPGCSIARPDGSSAGITALINTPNATDGTPCIDFARSSRGRNSTTDVDKNGNPLAFLPFATDGLKYASSYPTTSYPSVPVSNAPQNLTAAQLKLIYTCAATTWNDSRIGGTSATTIKPVIPQAGSGTRVFFEAQIGITDAQLGTCVTAVQEHDPAPIRATADNIGPFSVARFNSVDSDQGIQLDASGFSATRTVYNVAKLDPATLAVVGNVQQFLGDGSGTVSSTLNWICSAAGQQVVTKDGFTPLPVGTAAGNCGVAA